MSKLEILKLGSFLASEFEVALSFLLNPWASTLSLLTHLLLQYPKSVIDARTHPNGGNDVTSIFHAPKPYKSCIELT